MCGEALELTWHDSNLFPSKEEIRRFCGWWQNMSGGQYKPAAFVIRMVLFQVGLGGGRSRALGDGMGQVASFYLNRIHADSLAQRHLPISHLWQLLSPAMPPPG
jgi:hypothetical protein